MDNPAYSVRASTRWDTKSARLRSNKSREEGRGQLSVSREADLGDFLTGPNVLFDRSPQKIERDGLRTQLQI